MTIDWHHAGIQHRAHYRQHTILELIKQRKAIKRDMNKFDLSESTRAALQVRLNEMAKRIDNLKRGLDQ